jgi:hypothetical protein
VWRRIASSSSIAEVSTCTSSLLDHDICPTPFLPDAAGRNDLALVLEDDAVLAPSFLRRVSELLIGMRGKRNWDICLLGYTLPEQVEEEATKELRRKRKGVFKMTDLMYKVSLTDGFYHLS